MSSLSGPILITGASGFVGANLCDYFAARGHEVIGIAGPAQRDWRLRRMSHKNLRTVQTDLTSESETRKLIQDVKPATVINCAAYGAYSSQMDAEKIYQVNFHAVRIMLDAVKELKDFRAFIQAGSSSEYGINCTAPSEDAPTIPDSHYAVSKVSATALTRFYAAKHGVPTWTFRLYSVYGPYEEASRLIPKLLMSAREKKLPPLVNPKISRDFVYVNDVSRAFEALIQQADHVPKGEIFNIGAHKKVTLGELVEVARETFSIAQTPDWGSMPDRHWDHADWYSDSSKALKLLNWSAQTSLSDGLKATLAWMEKNPEAVQESVLNSILTEAKK